MRLLIPILMVALVGCAADGNQVRVCAVAPVAGSALVYRHSKPLESKVTVSGDVGTPLLDKIAKIDTGPLAFSLPATIRAITDPSGFPFDAALSLAFPLKDVLTQGSKVEIARIEAEQKLETTEVFLPDKALKVSVKSADVEIVVDGK